MIPDSIEDPEDEDPPPPGVFFDEAESPSELPSAGRLLGRGSPGL